MISKRHKLERAKKIAFWKPHIAAWRDSKLGATAYCRQHGLSLHKFKYWQYQIAKDDLSGLVDQAAICTTQADFVEVAQSSQVQPTLDLSAPCEIVTQHGFSINLHDGLSKQNFQNVLLALKALT